MSGQAYADVVVVGAGHAGVQVAVSLATAPSPPSVRLVGAEPGLPYERPPLTKRLLYGAGDQDSVPLRSAQYWQRSPVVLRTGDPVVAVDPAARLLLTAQGESIAYGSLVWAAGGRAAVSGLPGEQLRGVHSVRTFADLRGLRQEVATARTAVVVGGGYLGLEAAAGLRQLGLAVTVVEIAPRLLARVTGTTVSEFFLRLHRGVGVDVRLGVGVERLLGNGRVDGVLLRDGTRLGADVVLVAVGMRPEVAPLLAAGARGDDAGVDVDDRCRTSLHGVHAIGDCARQANPWSPNGRALRVESVHNANQHAATVVRDLCGLPTRTPAPPRFWSTQHGRELRTVGMPAPGDDEVLRGEPGGTSFSVVYLRDGLMVAADTVDRPRDFARAQGLVAGRWRPSRAQVSDDELPRAVPVGSPG